MTHEMDWNAGVIVDSKVSPGVFATSNDKLAKGLNSIPPLSSKEVQALSNDDLKKGIIEGKCKMKPVKELRSAGVTNVIAFIRSLGQEVAISSQVFQVALRHWEKPFLC
jgi:hypothetical protein